ncbi:cytosolic carboxypeptidase 6-like isoform X2 [Teleopsis dalmanni]|uniref:cytosolic carboxypeptidase 6-like isoform X2 n=1 Tax=Teleopsis dalmanni TaxID=139649 RepID=UPI0018CE84EB|nr:cytosolic carboxypeptidase 6-like isoform X2 [Teleopsis dalmanni]
MIGIACDPLRHTSMYERMQEESEDSDGEGGLGNVSRVIIRPPGQSGKAKRGHLCFDAAFETGNLGKADLVGDFEYDLYLRPDTCNPRYRFWFNFTVDNVKVDQRVIFNVVNMSKPRNLFNSNLTPLVKSSSRPKWQRLPKKNVFYYRSILHQNQYVLSFAFSFDKEDDVYQFAAALPYSYSRLQSYLNVLDAKQTELRFKRSVMAKTLQNRNLDLITIDHVTGKMKTNRIEKSFIRVIVVICRLHGAEAPASFVCQGFLEFLVGNHPIANVLRENFVFKILPMVNPDGVFLGNNRCNLIGQDLNRVWHIATEYSHPTVFAIRNMLKELDNSDSYQIDFVFDIHAHTSMHGSFIYGNTYEDVYRYERHLVFPRLFAANAADYVQSNMMFNADERKIGCVRRFCCERLSDTINSYTLEISVGGHYLRDGKTIALYTEDGYYRCGRTLVRTLLQYYRFINVLAVPVPPDIRQKHKNRPRTHQSRSRSKTRYEVKPRPQTTRYYAPISYMNISINYDSCGSSDEGGFSPLRPKGPGCSHFSGYRSIGRHDPEQFTLPIINTKRYDTLNQPHEGFYKGSRSIAEKTIKLPTHIYEPSVNMPPKPYLSIIDLNQLTRGSLNVKSNILGNS